MRTQKQRNKETKRKRGGFTLVEFLLYLAFLIIFLVILSDIFVSIVELKLGTESVSSVEQDNRFITGRLIYDVHRASSITTPATLGATSSSLVLVISGVTNTYQLNGTDLELTNNFGTHKLNGSETKISNPFFQRIGNSGGKPTVKINLSVTSRTERPGVGFEVRIASTTVGLR